MLRKITQTTREYPSIIIIFSSGHIKLRYSGDDSAQELFALTYPEVLLDKEIQVTGLSWSSNGSSVLVGYGSTSHEGSMHAQRCRLFVEHRTAQDQPEQTGHGGGDECMCHKYCLPSREARHCGCRSLQWFVHERVRFLRIFSIAGEILVWDFREQDSLIARVLERQDLHRDSVTSLQWIREPKLSKKKHIVGVPIRKCGCGRTGVITCSSSPPARTGRFSSGIRCQARTI